MKKLNNSKKAAFSKQTAATIIIGIFLLVVLLEVFANVVPLAQTAGNKYNISGQCVDVGCFYNASNDNSTSGAACIQGPGLTNDTCTAANWNNGLPLAGLFNGSSGVIFIVVMASLLILIVLAYLKFKK